MKKTLLRRTANGPHSRRPTARCAARFGVKFGRNAALGAVLAVALIVAACGLRTAPRPVEDTAPIIEGSVETTTVGGTVVVRWPRAQKSADGKRLYDLAAFVVERSRDGGPFERVATINVIDQEKIRRRSKFEYRDETPGAGALAYRVRAVCADGQEGPPTAAAATSAAASAR